MVGWEREGEHPGKAGTGAGSSCICLSSLFPTSQGETGWKPQVLSILVTLHDWQSWGCGHIWIKQSLLQEYFIRIEACKERRKTVAENLLWKIEQLRFPHGWNDLEIRWKLKPHEVIECCAVASREARFSPYEEDEALWNIHIYYNVYYSIHVYFIL